MVRWLPDHIEALEGCLLAGLPHPSGVATPLSPVCFGGNFLTTGKRSRKTRAWSGLSLGVLGVIEGHILTPHPPPSPTKNPRHPSPGCMTGTATLLVPPGSNWEGRAGPTPTKHMTQIPQTSLSVPSAQVTHQRSRLPVPTVGHQVAHVPTSWDSQKVRSYFSLHEECRRVSLLLDPFLPGQGRM